MTFTQTFSTKYPALFASVTTEAFQLFLNQAENEINSIDWGNLRENALEALLGHILTLRRQSETTQTTSGAIEEFERRDDSYRVRYSPKTADKLNQTSFGQEYLRLLEMLDSRHIETSSVPQKRRHFISHRH